MASVEALRKPDFSGTASAAFTTKGAVLGGHSEGMCHMHSTILYLTFELFEFAVTLAHKAAKNRGWS